MPQHSQLSSSVLALAQHAVGTSLLTFQTCYLHEEAGDQTSANVGIILLILPGYAAVWWEKCRKENNNKKHTWSKRYFLNKMRPTNPNAVAYSCVAHFCETSYLNSLVHFPPVTVQVHCRLWMWNGVECKAQSVKKVECLLGNVVCRVWSGDCGV